MKIIDKKDNQIVFMTHIEESLANAIRRSINQIPVIAIDYVEISRNDSPLYDETIAHRLGLVPLKMEKALDSKKETKLSLSSKEEGYVYSKEIKGSVNVVYGNIPLTILNKGQELELTATLKTGKGEEHSKFNPGIMFYRNVIDVKIGSDCPPEVVDFCPRKILKANGGKVTVTDPNLCDMCEACIEINLKKGKKAIELIPKDELVITLESFGQLEVEDIFKKAVDVLKKELAEVSKKVGK